MKQRRTLELLGLMLPTFAASKYCQSRAGELGTPEDQDSLEHSTAVFHFRSFGGLQCQIESQCCS
jgi:hypothetical protein